MTYAAILTFAFILFSATLLKTSSSYETELVNICAYSADPSEYTPKCYDCVKVVYTNALFACVNSTSMPKNITYKGANCMEQNCKVELPKDPQETGNMPPFWEAFSRLFMPYSPLMRSIRSVKSNAVATSNALDKQLKLKVVQHVETYVGDIEFGEPEYAA